MKKVARTGLSGSIALGAACAAMAVPAQAQETSVFCADVEGALPAVYLAQGAATIAAESERQWSLDAAQSLLETLATIEDEGLHTADYRPEALRAAMAEGESLRLDNVAGAIFGWLVQDLRDGRTPRSARRSYNVVDPDARLYPASALMERVRAGEDVGQVLASLNPVHPDYAALRMALAATPFDDPERRDLIRANMDRWRWLPRDLGPTHLLVNVPEFRLRLMVEGEITRSHRVIVGIPGRSATPQFSDLVEGVIFNPTWTVPQSIVVGEGLGRRVLNNPAWARSRGYVATRGANGYVSVVQQPGPQNALGLVKLDMPNPHAVFLHDTPARQRFEEDYRALSHGCIRTQGVLDLAFNLVEMDGVMDREEAEAISASGEYTRVPFATPIPVHIAYFTMGVDENGDVAQFADLYDRDPPLLASIAAPVSGRRLLD